MRSVFCCKCDFNVGRKGQPLTLDSQARTHAWMREGGREAGMESDRWKAGRQANRQEQCFRGIQSLGLLSVLHFNPWKKCSFKIQLNFSGKELFWYPNYNDTCIFLCREYVIILFKAIFLLVIKCTIKCT